MISTLKKKLNKKGFTLAELLVVVAIIAVLVAIAIPVFGGALGKANHAADLANVRAAYAEELVTAMTADSFGKNGSTAVELDLSTIAKAMKNKGSTVSVDTNAADTVKTITVALDGYTGSFTTDKEVTFKLATGVYTAPTAIYNTGTTSPAT